MHTVQVYPCILCTGTHAQYAAKVLNLKVVNLEGESRRRRLPPS
jgi:hypothetical protein